MFLPFPTNSWYSSFCLPLSPLILWSQPGGVSPRAKHMLLSIALIQIQRAGIIAGVAVLSQGFVPLWLPSARHTPFQSTAFEGCLFLSNLRTSPMMWTFNKPLHASPRACTLRMKGPAVSLLHLIIHMLVCISLLVRVIFIALLIRMYSVKVMPHGVNFIDESNDQITVKLSKAKSCDKCRHYQPALFSAYFYLYLNLTLYYISLYIIYSNKKYV